MKYKLTKEKAVQSLNGFYGGLIIGNEVPTIAELLHQILNQVPQDQRTEEEYKKRFFVLEQLHSLVSSDTLDHIVFSLNQLDEIKKGAFNMGLTPEAYFHFIQAFTIC